MPSLHRSFRHLAAALALGLATVGAGQDIELIPFGPVSLDEKTGEVVATGGAQIVYGDWLLRADTIRYNQKTGEANATGSVVFSREDLRLVSDSLFYNPKLPFARVENFRAGNGRVYIDGSLLEGNPDNFRFTDVNFYPGEPGTFLFEARAGELTLVDQSEIRGKRLFFKVGPVPFLLIPNITQPIDAETNLFRPTLDYSGHIGGAIGAEILAPVSNNLRLGGNVALTTKRGVLFGPAARYNAEGEGESVEGSFISGYIDDQGELGADVLGNPIDDERYFAEWSHQQFWRDDRLSLSAYLRYWSDSEVTRDFYEDSFDQMQDPDSYIEADYNADNWQISLFTRAALNDFSFPTERLPELRFTLLPTKLGHGFSNNGFLSAARLQRDVAPGGDISATKLDSYYGVEWNHALRDGAHLRLKAGARGIRYDDAETYFVHESPGGAFPEFVHRSEVTGHRAFGELGADLNLKAYATFDFNEETWNIRGLRHIIEPRLSYRYVPELWNDEALVAQPYGIPEVYGRAYGDSMLYADRGAFANYLPSIDLENRRDVDNLREDHKLRFELKNRIQTRHKEGGSRDLIRFDIATDYYLSGSDYAEKQFSLLHLDFELTPAPWLEIGVFNRLDPEDGFSNQELNAHIAIQDPGYWRVAFGSHYLDGVDSSRYAGGFREAFQPYYAWQLWPNYGRAYPDYRNRRLEQYFAHFEYQFSENVKLYATARYDAETGVFYEQRIGLMQRALERYGLKYEIRIYDGDRREDDFGVSLGIDLFDEP